MLFMKHLFIFTSFIAFLTACTKDNNQSQEVKTDISSTLNIEVRHYFPDSLGIVTDTPLHHFPVYLFQNFNEANNNENLLISKLTDVNGITSFLKLDSVQYAIRVEHPALGIKIKTVYTPYKSVVNQVIVY